MNKCNFTPKNSDIKKQQKPLREQVGNDTNKITSTKPKERSKITRDTHSTG
jgi:hypothetical protein